MDPIDDIVKDAMKALEARSTPRDYFDQLPDRINVRLEGSMQHEPSIDPSVPPISDGVVHADASQEDSGLHDIKELAQTAKRRVSRRQTSQHEIDQTMLASTQSGLHAVALPDPAKMVSLPTVEEARQLARSTAGFATVTAEEVDTKSERPAIAAREPAAARSKGVPVWMWAGGGLAAAAAAVMGFVVLGGKEPTEAQKQEPAAAAEQVKAEPTKATDDGITTRGLAEGGSAGSGAAGAVAAPPPMADPAPAPAVVPEEEAAKPDDSAREKKKKERDADKGDDAKADKKEDKVKTDDAIVPPKDVKKDDAKKGKGDGKTPPPDGKKELGGAVLGSGDKDELGIGDALESGGGGGKKTDEEPAKTELTNQEVRDGLDAINGKAKACYGSHGQTGTVKVKLTIAPSGKVSKASASGDLAGTPAGDCVVAAVKSASFPPWDGAPKSTSYVVLLSD